MKDTIQKLKNSAVASIAVAETPDALEEIRTQVLGRKSELTEMLKTLGAMTAEEKRELGPLLQSAKQEITDALSARQSDLEQNAFDWEGERIDVTLPGKSTARGHLHPMTLVLRDIERIFTSMGFDVADGPEIETEFYNFDALNILRNHPARDMMDTFVIDKEKELIARTHVSAIQVRYMQKHKPPFRVIMPGRVFRNEATDASHEHTFHQVDGMMVGEDVSVANYFSLIEQFLSAYFGKKVIIRTRPSFFPFTEPSFEIDFKCLICEGKGCPVCKRSGWIEIIPGGMVNQNVFVAAGYERNKYQGFAFDIGVERLAMMKYKIDDIRLFHSGDLRFVKQF